MLGHGPNIVRVHLLTFSDLLEKEGLSSMFFQSTMTCKDGSVACGSEYLDSQWMPETSLHGASFETCHGSLSSNGHSSLKFDPLVTSPIQVDSSFMIPRKSMPKVETSLPCEEYTSNSLCQQSRMEVVQLLGSVQPWVDLIHPNH